MGRAAVPKPGLVFHLTLGETLHTSDQKQSKEVGVIITKIAMINLRQHWKKAIDNAGKMQPQLQNSQGFKLNITLRCKAKEKEEKKRAKQAGSHTTQKCFEVSVPHQGEGSDTSRSTSLQSRAQDARSHPAGPIQLFELFRVFLQDNK